MTPNNFPKFQINYNLRESGGNILETSLLLNLRGENLEEIISLFEEAKEKLNNPSGRTDDKHKDLVIKFLDSNNHKPCPQCGSSLVLRTAAKSGRKFYGCDRYPMCDATMPC